MANKKERLSSGFTSHNKVTLVPGGKPYFDCLLELIRSARISLHLQVYIFEADQTGHMVADALKEAVKNGADVYVLADGYASNSLPDAFIRDLRNAGVNFRYFQPLLKSEHFYFGRRLHHKIAIADGRTCLVGGINISNNYNDVPGNPAWMDWALLVEGETALQLLRVAISNWVKPTMPSKLKKKLFHFPEDPFPQEECLVRIRRNDWVKNKKQISGSYISMLQHARSSVIIMSGYFLPGSKIRYNLSKAAKRGVNIKVIVTGISDVPLAKHAERYMYRWMLRRNIEIYEYNKSILHGKMAVRDTEWVTIGSYNVNDISAYASIELNLEVKNTEFARDTQHKLETIIRNDCTIVTEEYIENTYHFIQRAVQYSAYLIVRILYYLFTFYFKQQ